MEFPNVSEYIETVFCFLGMKIASEYSGKVN